MGSNSSKLCCSKPRKKKEASPENKEVSQELAALQSDGDLPGAACKRLQKADVSLLECHEKELQTVREEHEQELARLREDLRSTHNVEKQQLQYQHADYFEKLKREQQKKEVDLSDSRIVELKARHSEYINVLKGESEIALAGLVKQHKQEQESLTESFEKASMCLKERIEELTTQVNSFQMKTKKIEDAILRRDLHRDNKNSRPPTLFWEQELESLHFVVEMKNERIHHLDKQVLQMKNLVHSAVHQYWHNYGLTRALSLIFSFCCGSILLLKQRFISSLPCLSCQVEVNIVLQERVKTLQQENEDLKARLQNQQAFSRQLSMEHESLQHTLEKEAMMKDRLFHEKEELVWKLQNGDGSPTGEAPWRQLHSESMETSLT
ncbi:coiled-coil domain-containing protein 69-like isoform X1 [Rhinoraja longicauda]